MRRVKSGSVLKSLALLMVVGVAIGVPTADGVTIVSQDDPAVTAEISFAGGAGDDGDKVTSWIVGGEDHAFQKSYWYRIGDDPEQAISSLDFVGAIPAFTGDSYLTRWEDPQDRFQIDLRVSIGGAGDTSGLPVEIIVTSLSALAPADLQFHLFELVDMDLGVSTADDTLQVTGGNAVEQTGDGWRFTTNSSVTWNAVNGANALFPSHWQASNYADLTNMFGDGAANDLTDSSSYTAGDDGEFAFQWSFLLDGTPDNLDDVFTLDINQHITPGGPVIPEPLTGLAGTIGLMGLGMWVTGRRRSSR